MSSADCAAFLLAGGNSTRMGRPKALLDFHGEPLWRFQARTLLNLAPYQLFISWPPALEAPAGPWKILHDDQPGLGPLAGLARVAREVTTPWVVVLAVDMPAMTTTFLRALLDRAQAHRLGQVPRLEDRDLALAAVYPREVLAGIETNLHGADRSLQKFIRSAVVAGQVERWPVSSVERPMFANLNSPAEYASHAGALSAKLPVR